MSKDTKSAALSIYDELLEGTNSTRKQNSIRNIWSALEHLRKTKSEDYSVANIGRVIQVLKLNGPKAQSIRNTEGQDYRDLIDAYAAEYATVATRKEVPLDDEIVAGINDQRLAALVQMTLAENKSLERRNDMLKNYISSQEPKENLRVENTSINAPVQRLAAPVVGQFRGPANTLGHFIGENDARILRAFLENVGDSGFEVDPSGALLNPTGAYEIAPPGFIHALQRASGFVEAS